MTDDAGGLAPETRREVETLASDWVADRGVPGLSLAVVDGAEPVYAEGFGSRDLASNAPATPETLYGVGSCTKSLTALAIQRLAAAGHLAVDDPVADHLPHLADAPGEPVTVHDLLAHTSGMPSDGALAALLTRLTGDEAGEDPVPLGDEADVRRHVEDSTGERVTGDRPFFYYNTGYTLLGKVVEAASGRAFPAYVREEILDPLGMDRSTFSRADFEAADDRMTPYRLEDGEPEPARLAVDPTLAAPGGLVSSVADLSAYLRMAVGGGSLGDVRVVETERLDAMVERHATREVTLDGTEVGYGYGWQVRDFLDDVLVDHGGSMAVTSGYLGFLRERGLGVAIGCNASPSPHPAVLGRATLAVCRGESPVDAVPWFALREKGEPLLGEYESYRGITTATVERVGGRLRVELGDERWSEELALVPESLDPDDRRFFTVSATGTRTPVRFAVGEDGVDLFVRRWRLHKRG